MTRPASDTSEQEFRERIEAAKALGQSTIIPGVTSRYQWLWSDLGSGADQDMTIVRPVTESLEFFIVGDYAYNNYGPAIGTSMILAQVVSDPRDPLPPLKQPISYQKIWDDKGSGGKYDGSIWFPVPPENYVTLGWVVQQGYDTPYIPNFRCVRMDFCQASSFIGEIWTDKGSGADEDVELFLINPGGYVSNCFYAQRGYGPPLGPVYSLKPGL
jgi:hypothetical protein